MVQLLANEQQALRDLAEWLRARFGPRLVQLTLFGSRARGEGSEDSDVDVAIVVEGLTSREGTDVGHFCGDLLTQHDVLISAVTWSADHFAELRSRERLIVSEIDRDGIPL